MLQIKHNEVAGYKEKRIMYSTFSINEEAKGLAIMFPGIGYTVQGPLFHFATSIFLNKEIDVLQLEYPYGDSFYDHFTDQQLVEAVKHDSEVVIDQVLENKDYDYFYLIGKSFGTIALSNGIRKTRFEQAKTVWLPPLLRHDDVWNAMKESTGEGLCFIGDQDSHYEQNRFKVLENNQNMKTKLYNKVNHGMEYEGDILMSIDILKDIMREVNHF